MGESNDDRRAADVCGNTGESAANATWRVEAATREATYAIGGNGRFWLICVLLCSAGCGSSRFVLSTPIATEATSTMVASSAATAVVPAPQPPTVPPSAISHAEATGDSALAGSVTVGKQIKRTSLEQGAVVKPVGNWEPRQHPETSPETGREHDLAAGQDGKSAQVAAYLEESDAESVIRTESAMASAGADPIDIAASIEDSTPSVLLDLGEALSLASGRNPRVNFANERIREAYAQLDEAEVLWLPSLRLGMNYHYRDGIIQNARGDVFDTSRQSMYFGAASRVVGGGAVGLPGVWMQFHLADAVFQPRIASQAAGARNCAAQAMINDTLLEVALAYLQLLQGLQEQTIARETYENAKRLADLCRDFAEAGLASEADADRAATEVSLRENLLQRARENVAVASTELARLLSGDPTVPIMPLETGVTPIELVDRVATVRGLVSTGLSQRPELRENSALVQEAVERLNRELYAPLIPSLLLGTSYGGMAAGQGASLDHSGDRIDFDIALWWEVRQFGLGERAIRDANRSRVEQGRWRQVQLMDQVAQEISAAHARVQARSQQMTIAQGAIQHAVESQRRNLDRVEQGAGLPIEALQSIQALDMARREYLRSVIDYNSAQFQLYRSLGWPISSYLPHANTPGEPVGLPPVPSVPSTASPDAP